MAMVFNGQNLRKAVPIALCITLVLFLVSYSQDSPLFGWPTTISSDCDWMLDSKNEYRLSRHLVPGAKEYVFNIEDMTVAMGSGKSHLTLINGKFPGPLIEAREGDLIRVTVVNSGKQPTSIHFHGMSQYETNFMDGASGSTQCAIPPGKNFTYEFTADKAGTFWYHGSLDARSNQITRGVIGPMVVRSEQDIFNNPEETVLLLTDRYKDSIEELALGYEEPWIGGDLPETEFFLPQLLLKSQRLLSEGIRHNLRIVNAAMDTSFRISMKGHTSQLIELDSTMIIPMAVDSATISPGQRITLSLNMSRSTQESDLIRLPRYAKGNYGRNTVPLAYDGIEIGLLERADQDDLNDVFDSESKFSERQPRVPPSADHTVYLEARTIRDEEGCAQSCFNNTSFRIRDRSSPTLERLIDTAAVPRNHHSHKKAHNILTSPDELRFKLNSTIDLIVRNMDSRGYSFHLHGHQVWVMDRGSGDVTMSDNKETLRRDTVWVPGNQWVRLRFTSNNPGVWLFHCHSFWHSIMGMSKEVIVEPENSKLDPPPEWYDLCYD